ncbi:MAG: hypothetical protein MUP21_10675 [Dehalococcoidia bacterium]|nr:hypothetical protein [Dehalococcoidia bacterium]
MSVTRPISIVILALVLILMSSLPAFAEGSSLADVESEIDTVQWGLVYHSLDSGEGYCGTLRLLIVLEIADKFVEGAMAEYAQTGEFTEKASRSINIAVNLLERAKSITGDGGFDINSTVNKAVDTEIRREERLNECGLLRMGDIPWTGASMEAYSNCTTVDSYIDVIIDRINLWPQD